MDQLVAKKQLRKVINLEHGVVYSALNDCHGCGRYRCFPSFCVGSNGQSETLLALYLAITTLMACKRNKFQICMLKIGELLNKKTVKRCNKLTNHSFTLFWYRPSLCASANSVNGSKGIVSWVHLVLLGGQVVSWICFWLKCTKHLGGYHCAFFCFTKSTHFFLLLCLFTSLSWISVLFE